MDSPVSRYRMTVLGLDPGPEPLRARVAERVAAMAEAGLVEEVRRLAERPLSRTARQALGYKELLDAMEQGTPESQALEGFSKVGKSNPIFAIDLHTPAQDVAVGQWLAVHGYRAFRLRDDTARAKKVGGGLVSVVVVVDPPPPAAVFGSGIHAAIELS